ncbi:MAG: class I SAM-dependent methyltransferase [Methylocapsa sp.]|nr:class I SAM-dependent methyltransferase [Methylocapsa sp.]
MPAQTDVPLCPLTGQPAVRQIQWVSARLLRDLWHFVFKVDAREALLGIDLFGLWESPTGLYFFDPPREGNSAFYDQFYARITSLRLFSQAHIRNEFTMAARSIPAGARVLDVGCGLGNFKSCLPHANYTGLDPHTGIRSGAAAIRGESLADHLLGHARAYDAVCAFQVLEHVQKPAELFAEMVQAAKPGGLIFAGVPHVRSPAARIPNYIINAPPHHLTWWTEAALAELARGAGASVEAIEHVPWGRSDALIYWIERCAPIKCKDEYYRGHWSWHASAALGLIAGLAVSKLAGVPSGSGEGSGLLLTARRMQ